MPVHNRIAEFHAEMTEWRQDLHRHPELAFQEFRTSQVVQDKLREFGVDEVITGLATTGHIYVDFKGDYYELDPRVPIRPKTS